MWEDNNRALVIEASKTPRIIPRSKNIEVYYHWFQKLINKASVCVKPMYYNNQKGDIFTNPLPKVYLYNKRNIFMGW